MSTENKINLDMSLNHSVVKNFDNTASLRQIVSSFNKKGRQYIIPHFINCTTRRRPRSANFCFTDFILPSQPRNFFSADWDGGLNTGFFENLPFKSLMPWMITGAQNIGKIDPVVDLLHQKHEWAEKWSSLKTSWSLKTKSFYKWFGDDVLYCPKLFIAMAAHLETNPDPFFSQAYNWYYAGAGNLLVARIHDCDFIMHSEFNCLYVSPFFKDTLSIDYSNSATYKCPEEMNILETIHSQHFVALRTKCKVIILELTTSEMPLKLQRLKEIDSELPFTSITFDQFHKNILYVTTLDYKLTIVNLDRMKCRSTKLRGKFTKLANNWSKVVGGERENYAHVTKKAIALYDKRNQQPYQRYKSFKHVSDIETCYNITAVKYCQGKPLMYVATDHQLFLMDMRCDRTKTGNMKPVQRWSHGMMCAPTYIDICAHDPARNKELVCLSSQWMEDMCLVTNYSDTLTRTGEIPSMSVPYRPPSIIETFNEAHRKKLCYDLYDQIHRRLCTAISGLAVVDHGENTAILMQNALGDISCHALYPKHMCAFIEDDSIEKLHVWCKDYKEEPMKFKVSKVADIRMFLKHLRVVPPDYKLGMTPVIKHKENFDENEIHETYENEELDPEFLEIWKDKSDEITLGNTGASEFFDGSE